MTVEELDDEVLVRLKERRYDRIIEKHEGPFSWEYQLRTYQPDDMIYRIDPNFDAIAETPQFMAVGEYWVLFPVGREHHPNITILSWFANNDLTKIVIYLTDTTYYDDLSMSGYVAICEQFEADPFYTTTLYHEWYDPKN